jgi:DNA-binding GntR family transcriptional regulator
MTPLPSPPGTSRAAAVFEALRRAIVERELDPGEPLTEHDLCRRFKVSRTPVREALARLERDRLVRVVPNKGAFVRTVSHDEIRDAYQVREALEPLAVRLAAPRVERAELEDFERRFRELRTRGAGVQYTRVRALGEEFHRYLLKRADNAKLLHVLEQIREQIGSVWTMSILAPRRVQGLIREHLAVIDALKRGKVSRAERAMALHVRRVREAIFTLVD